VVRLIIFQERQGPLLEERDFSGDLSRGVVLSAFSVSTRIEFYSLPDDVVRAFQEDYPSDSDDFLDITSLAPMTGETVEDNHIFLLNFIRLQESGQDFLSDVEIVILQEISGRKGPMNDTLVFSAEGVLSETSMSRLAQCVSEVEMMAAISP